MPACGAQSVPARLNRLTNDDDAWEARTLMPGGLSLPHPPTPCCLHPATLHWLVRLGALGHVASHGLVCIRGCIHPVKGCKDCV